ncbi:WXG100 family type VII secretion target [Dactylosporangium darangshiense]|uniref:Uncharacterized protein n=1 Tax=Dactylosporangium darangshiense TaxID=579108 RepID=A0ABP8D3V1_9ACTN
MTDALDRLAAVGEDLLGRVGGVLVRGGVPEDGPVWELLRRVGALPGDVLDHALSLDVDGLRSAASELHGVAERFGALPERLEADVGRSAWEGSGAEAFGVVWNALAEHIGDGGDPGTIAGRLAVTASYLDALAGWAAGFRYDLAEVIARVATSAEAVTVRTAPTGLSAAGGVTGLSATVGPAAVTAAVGSAGLSAVVGPAAVAAAADREVGAAANRIAVLVLRSAVAAIEAAGELRGRWAGRLAELEYHPPLVPQGPALISGVTRVNL